MQSRKGFTLVEMMTSLSIFMIVMTVSLGSVLNILNDNRKAQSESTVMNNLNLAIETMSRDMRFGTRYVCGSGEAGPNCPGGDTSVSYISADGVPIVYQLSGTSLERKVGSGDPIPVTAPEIVIESLKFYVLGADSTDTKQPKVLVSVSGYSGATAETRTDFSLQTLVSQRILDNGL